MDINKIKDNTVITVTNCWEWQKSCNSAGYGQLTEDKTYWLAHRYAYACNNVLYKEQVIRHTCHNTRCCNPLHLVAGTHKDNWHDSRERHLERAIKSRKKWYVNSAEYNTVREAAQQTGIHQGTLIKYSVDGVFDITAYRAGCKKANVIPAL